MIASAAAIIMFVKYGLLRGIDQIANAMNWSTKTRGQLTGYATSVPEFVCLVSAGLAGVWEAGLWNIASSNIINAGLTQYRYGIWEGSANADPVAMDFNDIVGATEAVYLDEGYDPLISIGQVNALSDIQTGSNISVYPDLVNESPDGDLHLNPGSPCVDSGSSQGAPDHDMDGEPRPGGQAVDIGADERQ